MKHLFLLTFCLCSVLLGTTSCSYDSPEEEMCAILEDQGWELVSNCTNVYRKDIDHTASRKSGSRQYKTTYWYTAYIFCRQSGFETKHIAARVVYKDEVARRENGNLVYKTFSIDDCSYTDKYDRYFNGRIQDGGFDAYLNY